MTRGLSCNSWLFKHLDLCQHNLLQTYLKGGKKNHSVRGWSLGHYTIQVLSFKSLCCAWHVRQCHAEWRIHYKDKGELEALLYTQRVRISKHMGGCWFFLSPGRCENHTRALFHKWLLVTVMPLSHPRPYALLVWSVSTNFPVHWTLLKSRYKWKNNSFLSCSSERLGPHLSVQCSPSTLHAELLLTASEINPGLSDLYSAWPQFFLPASKLAVIPNALCLLKRIAKDASNKFIFSYLRNSPDSQNCRVATSPCWRQESLLHLGHFWKSGHWPGDLNGNAGEQHLIPLLKVLTA